MKLLVITQKIDRTDDILGFFHRWVEELSRHFEHVKVICLYKGEMSLPDNVEVYSLGKERNVSRFGLLKNFFRTYFSIRKDVDSIFIHMNEIYVYLLRLAFLFSKRKPIVFWKAHGNLSRASRFAAHLVSKIVTSSKAGFKVSTPKRVIVGQGIDTDLFEFKPRKFSKPLRLLYVGRLGPVKYVHHLIKSVSVLKNKLPVKLDIVGGTGKREYCGYLKELVEKLNIGGDVNFQGSVPHEKILEWYHKSDIFVNTGQTGSLDKTVLEAMASGTLVVTTNTGFKPILSRFDKNLYVENEPERIANAILHLNSLSEKNREELRKKLRQEVVENHNLKSQMKRIAKEIKSCVGGEEDS